MPKFNVHLYASVRVKRVGIKARNMEAALKIADKTDLHAVFDGLERIVDRTARREGIEAIEYAESITDYMVDVVGDAGFEKSRTFNDQHQPIDGIAKGFSMPRALRLCLQEGLDAYAEEFKKDSPINGGDLLDWFGEWRKKLAAMMSTNPAQRAPTKGQQLADIDGLTFADCVTFFASRRTKREKEIAELARANLQKDGEIEIDESAILSEGDDNGTYVLAWAWLDFADTPFDKEPESVETAAP